MPLCFVNANILLENKGKTVAVLCVTPAGIAEVGDGCESHLEVRFQCTSRASAFLCISSGGGGAGWQRRARCSCLKISQEVR